MDILLALLSYTIYSYAALKWTRTLNTIFKMYILVLYQFVGFTQMDANKIRCVCNFLIFKMNFRAISFFFSSNFHLAIFIFLSNIQMHCILSCAYTHCPCIFIHLYGATLTQYTVIKKDNKESFECITILNIKRCIFRFNFSFYLL